MPKGRKRSASTAGQPSPKKTRPTPSESEFCQPDETHYARVVLVHEPSLSNWMGSIHPTGSLYEEPVDIDTAKEEHQAFQDELRRNGCEVHTIHSVLVKDCAKDMRARIKLEALAKESVTYKLVNTDEDELTEADRFLLCEEYKTKCLEKMSENQLADVILTRPTICLVKADKDTALLACNYTFEPLVNLVFTRDQILTTAEGVVLSRLSSGIRKRETLVVQFCLEKLGVPVIGRVPAPGTIEGGEFFPAGRDLSFIGVGLRTNMFAVKYMMDNNLWGTERVAVVKDYFDQDQQRMHLDTVCNICAPKVMIILEDILGETSDKRRLVDEYVRDPSGGYYLSRHDVEYGSYLRDNGWSLITLTNEDQHNYGCNGLALGDTFLAVDEATAKKMVRSPHFEGSIKVLSFRNMTSMYGSLHCCSQVLSRSQQRKRRPHLVGSGDDEPLQEILEIVRELSGRATPPPAPVVEVTSTDVSYGNALPPRAFGKVDVKTVQQSPSQIMMIAPTNFNAVETTDNAFAEGALRKAMDLSKLRGPREMREKILQEYSKFHKMVTVDANVETFLFSHEAYHDTPEGVFVNDIWSTHSAKETGGERTLVIYAAKHKWRHNEGRRDLFDFLRQRYDRVVSFASAQQGENIVTDEPAPAADYTKASSTVMATEEVAMSDALHAAAEGDVDALKKMQAQGLSMDVANQDRRRLLHLAAAEGRLKVVEFLVGVVSNRHPVDRWGHTPLDEAIAHKHEKIVKILKAAVVETDAIEGGSLIIDRAEKTVFACNTTRCNPELALLWGKQMGYEVKMIDLDESMCHFHYCMCLATSFAVVCPEAMSNATQRAEVMEYVARTREIIVISLEQAAHFCASIVEVINRAGEPVVLMSTTAHNNFTVTQLETISRHAAIHHAPLDYLEEIGGGSTSGIMTGLY